MHIFVYISSPSGNDIKCQGYIFIPKPGSSKIQIFQWGRLTHCGLVCIFTSNSWVSISLVNGLVPIWHQTIIQTNADLLSITPLKIKSIWNSVHSVIIHIYIYIYSLFIITNAAQSPFKMGYLFPNTHDTDPIAQLAHEVRWNCVSTTNFVKRSVFSKLSW